MFQYYIFQYKTQQNYTIFEFACNDNCLGDLVTEVATNIRFVWSRSWSRYKHFGQKVNSLRALLYNCLQQFLPRGTLNGLLL